MGALVSSDPEPGKACHLGRSQLLAEAPHLLCSGYLGSEPKSKLSQIRSGSHYTDGDTSLAVVTLAS